MPLADEVGHSLALSVSMPMLLFLSCLLGAGVTYAEPSIGVLQTAGALLDESSAPALFRLLNEPDFTALLVMAVGGGVGLAAAVGMLRIQRRWAVKPITIITTLVVLGTTAAIYYFTLLREVVGLAWDLGAVTTGPVTVPVVLALGTGAAASRSKRLDDSTVSSQGDEEMLVVEPSSAVPHSGVSEPRRRSNEKLVSDGKIAERQSPLEREIGAKEPRNDVDVAGGDSGGDGFGVVTLASLFPIWTVLVMCTFLPLHPSPLNATLNTSLEVVGKNLSNPSDLTSPVKELAAASRAFVPLVLFLVALKWMVSRRGRDYLDSDDHASSTLAEDETAVNFVRATTPRSAGLFAGWLGLVVFYFGLEQGLIKLGASTGEALPLSFLPSPSSPSPLYSLGWGKVIAIAFSWIVGFASTFAEPALAALALKVQ
mmetsp:Transcript_8525/g.22760  ORF Transcript_8525/g.22760 Transcript_8525/m.22760 type:complete len:427 (-) Transcript_8525:971-2251(-)